jgi:hypothetical protein
MEHAYDMRNACKILVRKPEGTRPFGVDGRIIPRWISKKPSTDWMHLTQLRDQ